ncbi:MAG TPA: hypothetical protein VKV74_08885 [Bryobacteraceae bacterium]|nr:hypothetical protein [Bryobacteraceae bacterium]
MPSRRQSRQTGPVYRAKSNLPSFTPCTHNALAVRPGQVQFTAQSAFILLSPKPPPTRLG